MSPPTEAPIPMSLPESIVVATAHMETLDPRTRRAIEQLIRHAQQARKAATTSTDMTGLLLGTSRDLRVLAQRLDDALESSR